MVATTPKTRKAKGRKFQQEVAERISGLLTIPVEKDGDIESRPMGQAGPDVILRGEAKKLFPFAVETKFTEKWNVSKWIEQAKSNSSEDLDWLLICKKSRTSPVVIMDIDLFFRLYEEILKGKMYGKLLKGGFKWKK